MADVFHTEPEATMPQHKPAYSDMCNICGPRVAERRLRTQRVVSLHKGLVEFGYRGLTLTETGEAYDKAMAGPITDSDIIAMFVRRQLEDAHLV